MAKESSGMNLLIELNLDQSEDEIIAAARSVNLPLVSTREYYIVDPTPNQFLIPFAHIDDAQIVPITREFAAALLPQPA
jgi:DNA-binding transcriptional MocR family regulator